MNYTRKESIPERKKIKTVNYTQKKKVAPITNEQASSICSL